jgi:hypothetical protein
MKFLFKYFKDDKLKMLFGIKNYIVGLHARYYYKKIRSYHSLEKLKDMGFNFKWFNDLFFLRGGKKVIRREN